MRGQFLSILYCIWSSMASLTGFDKFPPFVSRTPDTQTTSSRCFLRGLKAPPCCTLITGVVIDLCRCCHSYCTVYHLLFYVRVRVTMFTVFYHLCDIYFACFLAWQDKHHPGESLIYAWPRFTCFYFFLSVMFILFCSFGLLYSYLF